MITATGTSLNKRFNKQTYVVILVLFLAVLCEITTTNSALSEERDPRRLTFKIYISNYALCSMFSFEIGFTKKKKLNDFRVSRDWQVKYHFIF